jgi:hypothetical protein
VPQYGLDAQGRLIGGPRAIETNRPYTKAGVDKPTKNIVVVKWGMILLLLIIKDNYNTDRPFLSRPPQVEALLRQMGVIRQPP